MRRGAVKLQRCATQKWTTKITWLLFVCFIHTVANAQVLGTVSEKKSISEMVTSRLRGFYNSLLPNEENQRQELAESESEEIRSLTSDSCIRTTVDFSVSSSGTALTGGAYVSKEWEDYGLSLYSSGGAGIHPRLFDTSNVGADPDLGSPNQLCDPPGPGEGKGGEPGQEGQNCAFLGNVLIVQSTATDVPDDNSDGGSISFEFPDIVPFIYEIGLIDMDWATSITVVKDTGLGLVVSVLDVPMLGENSVQAFPINMDNVKQLKVNFSKSGGVTFISFCRAPGFMPPPAPIAAPISTPAPDTQTSPTTCKDMIVDFSKTADGTVLSGGTYVTNEWEQYGLTLSSSGGYGTRPRLFDTAFIGNEEYGDPDLGSPNEQCNPPGPGVGEAGAPGKPGENCDYLGNVLIIQEDNPDKTIPDDNVGGGTIKFKFSDEVQAVYAIGLLDVDYKLTITVVHGTETTTIHVPALGDNSVQTVAINKSDVKELTLEASASLAVIFISFNSCMSSSGPTTGLRPPPGVPTLPPVAPTKAPTSQPTKTPTLPPTEAPPTQAPPTDAPPTNAPPPTKTQPTNAPPPTGAPPTQALPTEALPTNAPPTNPPPTNAPSKTPTSGLQPSAASPTPSPHSCTGTKLTVDFSESADGTTLIGGMYVNTEWEQYGLKLYSSGGFGISPRLFNTSDVGRNPDLGSPNELCAPPGPGQGLGGQPGKVGENCDFLGNVLIVQNEDPAVSYPDVNPQGGVVSFDFPDRAEFVFDIGLLDVDGQTSVTIVKDTGFGLEVTTTAVPQLGKNSFQTFPVNVENMKQLKVNFSKLGGVAFINFCGPSNTTPIPVEPPPPPVAPTPAPIEPTLPPVEPTPRPVAPTPAPSTEAPPTGAPPTQAPPTNAPPTNMPPTNAPPTDAPPTQAPPSEAPPTNAPPTNPSLTHAPTASPTASPTVSPTKSLTANPTVSPTASPTRAPVAPTPVPVDPTPAPTATPTKTPTSPPTASPTASPTANPTASPTKSPTANPTVSPTASPTRAPVAPTPVPVDPTPAPTATPTASPTPSPTKSPTVSPTKSPTVSPTVSPTISPTSAPTKTPTAPPTASPTASPTKSPTANPTASPTKLPTASPTVSPTASPTRAPVAPTPAPVEPTPPPVAPTPSPVEPTLPPVEPSEPNRESTPESGGIVYGMQPSCNSQKDGFQICLDVKSSSGKKERWMDTFAGALAKWESIIVGDRPDVPTAGLPIGTDCTQYPASIDDIYICAEEGDIDGPGGILGSAGPGYSIYQPGTLNPLTDRGYARPITGQLKFDSLDMATYLSNGLFLDIVVHELGHVLGIGTLWNFNGLYTEGDETYTPGTAADRQWKALGCSGGLPVELDGGPGRAYSHWDDACLIDELLTFDIANVVNKQRVSQITAASLQDMGYEVDLKKADPYSIEMLGECGKFCPEHRPLILPPVPKKPLSDTGQRKVMRYAKEELARIQRINNKEEFPDDVASYGGDTITVLYEEDGEIYLLGCDWTEVKYLGV